jgi:hypothetical protein
MLGCGLRIGRVISMSDLVRVFVWTIGLMTFLAWPANGQSISVPAYNPPTGRETAFHVELEITTEQRGSDPLAPGTARGDFVDRLTVQKRTSDGFHMLWQFDAALPPAAHGREIDYPINSTFQEAIGLFGVDGLNVDTDLAGNPKSVFGADLIIDNMRARADEARGPDDPPIGEKLQERMQATLARDPAFMVQRLVPAARLLASAQADQVRADLRVGATETHDVTLPIGGVSAPGVLKRTLQSVDDGSHVAKFVWTLSVDQDAFTRASQDLINQEIESLRRKIGEIPPARLPELTTAEVTYSGEWRVSLDDGEAVFVEENIVSRVGPISTRVVSRVTRF